MTLADFVDQASVQELENLIADLEAFLVSPLGQLFSSELKGTLAASMPLILMRPRDNIELLDRESHIGASNALHKVLNFDDEIRRQVRNQIEIRTQ